MESSSLGLIITQTTGIFHFRLVQNSCIRSSLSRDGKTAASYDENGKIIVWATISGERICEISNTSPIIQLNWTPDDKYIVTVGKDRFIRLWKIATGELKKSFFNDRKIRLKSELSPDYNWLCKPLEGEEQFLHLIGFSPAPVLHAIKRLTLHSTAPLSINCGFINKEIRVKELADEITTMKESPIHQYVYNLLPSNVQKYLSLIGKKKKLRYFSHRFRAELTAVKEALNNILKNNGLFSQFGSGEFEGALETSLFIKNIRSDIKEQDSQFINKQILAKLFPKGIRSQDNYSGANDAGKSQENIESSVSNACPWCGRWVNVKGECENAVCEFCKNIFSVKLME
jgi:hypothetical protein